MPGFADATTQGIATSKLIAADNRTCRRRSDGKFLACPMPDSNEMRHPSTIMRSPWGKKNPWLSAWLGGANAIVGSTRGVWMREMRRQNDVFMRTTRKRTADFWLGSTGVRKKRK